VNIRGKDKPVFAPVPEMDAPVALEAIDYLGKYARQYLDALVEALDKGRTPEQIKAYLETRLPETKSTLIRHVYNAAKWIEVNGMPESFE
jgi:hypothetical protein